MTVTTQHTLSTLYYFIHVVAVVVNMTDCTPYFSTIPHVVSFAFGKRTIHTYDDVCVCACVCVIVCVCVWLTVWPSG